MAETNKETPVTEKAVESEQPVSAASEAEKKQLKEHERRLTELQNLRSEQEELRRELNTKRDHNNEEPWKQSLDPDSGRGLRNSRGHFTSMGKEHSEALPENERLNNILRKIEEVREALAEISRDLPRPDEEVWKQTYDESGGKRLRNSSGEYTTMEKEHEDALRMDAERDHAKEAADAATSSNYEPTDSGVTGTAGFPESSAYVADDDDHEPPADTPYSPENSDYAPEYSVEDTSYLPGYDPYSDPYLPEYAPDIPEYTPAPEIVDWRREALIFLNELARRDQERAIARYGGFRPFAAASGLLRMTNGVARLLSRGRGIVGLDRAAERIEQTDERISNGVIGRTIGRIRGWFDRVGSRQILNDEEIRDGDLDENLARVSNFQRTPGWRKALKIGAKLMGGFGVAAATIMTGGIGAPTALLWAGGMKEGFDSIGQTVEHLGWGRRRAALELESQGQETEQINALKAQVMERPMTRAEYEALVASVTESEANLNVRETENITGERRGQMIRSLATSAATIGVGLFGGVPFGKVNYDHDNTQIAETFRKAAGTPGAKVMEESHRGFWNVLNGGQFGYEHNSLLSAVRDSANGVQPTGLEHAKMLDIIDYLTKKGAGEWALTPTSVYGQTAHILGGNALPLADYLKLAAVPAYLAAEALRHFARRPEQSGGGSYYPYDDRHTPYSPYGPDGTDGTSGGYEARDTRHPEEETVAPTDHAELTSRERTAIDTYIERLGGRESSYLREVTEIDESMPAMSPECRFAVCVPAAFSEHRVIYDYLSSLLGQTDLHGDPLDSNVFEVNVFVNGTTDKQSEIDQTVSEIDRFKSEHPEIKVNVAKKSFAERQNIGYLRKLITDSALIRSKQRESQSGPIFLVSHDADIAIQDNQYFAKALESMNESYETKVLAGQVDYSKETKERYPYIWAARRLWQFMDSIRSGEDSPTLPRKAVGANTIIRADAYAEVNGFRSTDTIAEDLSLGNRVEQTYGRKGTTGQNRISNFRPRAIISPRRDIQSVERNRPIVGGYDNFAGNDAVREIVDGTHAEEITPDNAQLFVQKMDRESSSQFNHLFMSIFYSINDRTPEMNAARRNRAEKLELERIELRNLQGEPGRQAMRQAESIFRKACDYLGIEKIDISPASGGKYDCHIRQWSKLKEGLRTPE